VVSLREEKTMERSKRGLADENRHLNRWAQAQMVGGLPSYQQPMMMATHIPRSTLRPNNPREENAETEAEAP
jgi:hypothetical protein